MEETIRDWIAEVFRSAKNGRHGKPYGARDGWVATPNRWDGARVGSPKTRSTDGAGDIIGGSDPIIEPVKGRPPRSLGIAPRFP